MTRRLSNIEASGYARKAENIHRMLPSRTAGSINEYAACRRRAL